jgi:hypothetical protein
MKEGRRMTDQFLNGFFFCMGAFAFMSIFAILGKIWDWTKTWKR